MDVATDLAEVAASVAKALGLEKIEPEDYQVPHWKDGIFNSLLADGSNLFDPYWQIRCRDWLLERGEVLKYHKNDSFRWVKDTGARLARAHEIVQLTCPPSEACARAIHELMKREEQMRGIRGYVFQVHEMTPGEPGYETVRFVEQRDNVVDAQAIVDVLHATDVNWSVYCIVVKPVFSDAETPPPRWSESAEELHDAWLKARAVDGIKHHECMSMVAVGDRMLMEIKQLQKDAQRYKWLRKQPIEFNHSRIAPTRPDKLDALIDAALQKEPR